VILLVKLNKKDIEFLKDNFDNAEELINCDDANEILEEIDELILYKGFISHEKGYNDFGREAQKIYDNIYSNN